MSRLSLTDAETLQHSNSLPLVKRLQGELALSAVSQHEKGVERRSFGGIVLKTVPLSFLVGLDKRLLPEEYIERMSEDSHFFRLHFLPMGEKSAQNPGEALKMMALGTTDLLDFANWLRLETIEHQSLLKNRYILGLSTYELGRTIEKHLPVFEVIAESQPLNPNVPLERLMMVSEQSLNAMNINSSFMLLGSFVPEFLMHAQKIPFYQQKLFSLLQSRYPELRNLTQEKMEYELRRQAIYRASELIR